MQLLQGRTSLKADVLSLRASCPQLLVGTPGRLMQLLTEVGRTLSNLQE